jgi:hypothetical protein
MATKGSARMGHPICGQPFVNCAKPRDPEYVMRISNPGRPSTSTFALQPSSARLPVSLSDRRNKRFDVLVLSLNARFAWNAAAWCDRRLPAFSALQECSEKNRNRRLPKLARSISDNEATSHYCATPISSAPISRHKRGCWNICLCPPDPTGLGFVVRRSEHGKRSQRYASR